MPNEGSLVLIIILIVLQGVTGISFGLVISSAIDDEQSANQAALGIFYPNLIISGRPARTGLHPEMTSVTYLMWWRYNPLRKIWCQGYITTDFCLNLSTFFNKIKGTLCRKEEDLNYSEKLPN